MWINHEKLPEKIIKVTKWYIKMINNNNKQ